jgi:hypothetical protein
MNSSNENFKRDKFLQDFRCEEASVTIQEKTGKSISVRQVFLPSTSESIQSYIIGTDEKAIRFVR